MTGKLKVAVLGAGQMGSGIATLLADAGHSVTSWDAVPAALDRLPSSVKTTLDLEEAVTGADLIMEAIAEDLGVKHEVYKRISAVNDTGILASNTSSLPASELAKAVSNPGRFAIAHFFNPPRLVPLVEIVPASETREDVLQTLKAVLAAAGKLPVVLRKEVPGFVANRLQAALLREAFALVEDGVVAPEDLDLVVRASIAPRWAAGGPMTITDLGGLDIWKAVTTQLFPVLSNTDTPPRTITERVDRGELGAKTGTGIYQHQPEEDQKVRDRIEEHFKLEFPDL